MADHTEIVINEEKITEQQQENVNVNINSDSDTITKEPVDIDLDDIKNESLESKSLHKMANESVAKNMQLAESKQLLLASEYEFAIEKIYNLAQENPILFTANKLTIEKNTLNENVKSNVQQNHNRGEENQEIINKNDKDGVGDDMQEVQIESSIIIESKDKVMTADVIVDGELLKKINETDGLENDAESEIIKDIIRLMSDDKNDKNIIDNKQNVKIESSVIIENKDKVMTANVIVEHGQLLKTINKNETEILKNDAESENLKDVIHHSLMAMIDAIEGEFDSQKITEHLLLLISKINSNKKNINDKAFIDAQQKSSSIFTDAIEQHLQDDDNVLIENDAFENITDVKNNTSNENDEPMVKVSKCSDELIANNKIISVLENQDNETLSKRFSTSSTEDTYENCDTININSEEIFETNENNTSPRMVNVSVQTVSIEPNYRSFFIYWILNIIFIIFMVILTILFVCHLLIRSHIFYCPTVSHNSSNSVVATQQL